MANLLQIFYSKLYIKPTLLRRYYYYVAQITFPIPAPLDGIMWIGKQIIERANAELDDKENLPKQLLALQLAFDIGEIYEPTRWEKRIYLEVYSRYSRRTNHTD
ncbi:gas vesicle protein GvpG [Microseira sp. BLCC-F43]|uniref:gas vesicle protein GvpG n=1 Tax=Microseira sp. BLCC-F43 TaxID=3153602 RepID=UPI0035B75EE8